MQATTTPTLASVPGAEPVVEFDGRPVFEIWLDGHRFSATTCPAQHKRLHDTMTSGESSKRYGNRSIEFRVVNDRRATVRA